MNRRGILRAAGAAALLPAAARIQAAVQPARLALVLGNAHYAGSGTLPNAINDARLMAKTLAGLGFAVSEQYDLDRARLDAALERFAQGIPAGATAFVYYAGHGMQLGGANYLNPVDMPVTSEQGARLRAYPLKTMLERLAGSRSALNIVVLDACRNNPFQPQPAVRYRSLGGIGLRQVAAPRGTFIAYSTAPGQLAADGEGTNSLYTRALARTLLAPGQELEQVFRSVAQEVRRKTLDDQHPWYESSVAGSYYFRPQGGQPAGVPALAGVPTRQTQASRGIRIASGTAWYRQMGAAEWQAVDWEIGQRVRKLTRDDVPALERQARAGNVVAQTVLGLAYREGLDRARAPEGGSIVRFNANNGAAWHWLGKAAAAGFPVAQAEVGEMYYGAHGRARDLGASRRWLQQAAQADYPRARLDLAQLDIETGRGTGSARDALQSLFDSLKAAPPPSR